MEDRNFDIQNLEWDSQNFGFKVGKIVFINVPQEPFISCLKKVAKKLGYKLLYVFLPGNLFIDSCNVKLVDRKILYYKKINSVISTDDFCSENISLYTEGIVNDDLLNLAYESGKYSRFYLDSNFDKRIFYCLYSMWVQRSVSGEIADGILISKKAGHIVGMLTFRENCQSIDIGLIAIDRKCQGQGLGSKLIVKLEEITKARNCSQITVATQKHNLIACSFYERNKFKIKELTNIYHLWL